MPGAIDGPSSQFFEPLRLRGNVAVADLSQAGLSEGMAAQVENMPTGACVSWGIPLRVGRPVLIAEKPVSVKLQPVRARWLVFAHTSDERPLEWNEHGFISPMRGEGHLGVHAADYIIVYADGTEQRAAIRCRHEIGTYRGRWGENCFQAVAHVKPRPLGARSEDLVVHGSWGRNQTRATCPDRQPWTNWLWAWENPKPRKAIVGLRFEPVSGLIVISAVSAGKVSSQPLRWMSRQKAILRLPEGTPFEDGFDDKGLLAQVRMDLGQVISAVPRPLYPDRTWARTYNNGLPEISPTDVLVEYTAHPEARFHLGGGKSVDVANVTNTAAGGPIRHVEPARQRVTLRAVEKGSGKPVAVKLHVHGEAGEYLAPLDRHRIPNEQWFQDYSVDFTHANVHHCTYISGETTILLPLGRVYIEVSKGFDIRPVRKVCRVTRATGDITVEIEKVLPWRDRGWVSADTHVHFLSPPSAMLEGAGEGVNVVNLLASQWGELMTNVGDFDGKSTFGSKEAGGDGEYLVRVGTENHQHVLGHISLLGYDGAIIAPMTTGGPDESALGDPIDVLLCEWARQCREQNGVVVLPHSPNPRAEYAAAIVRGDVDAIEMTSWGNLYGGVDPYSLSDWYRYLNCGYFVPAVGGTDKMAASTPVGAIRTYARIDRDEAFTYEAWKRAIRRGHTFVTYGPLMEFAVEGHPPGEPIRMSATGGTVAVTWQVASVTIPMSRVDLVVNGEIVESVAAGPRAGEGSFAVTLDKSSWLALLVRGHYKDKPEIIAAHSSPVMVELAGVPFEAAADAMTILDQIEGALAYLDTLGTRAETTAYKRMRLALTSAHRELHNRMHRMGEYHKHSPVTDHAEHH